MWREFTPGSGHHPRICKCWLPVVPPPLLPRVCQSLITHAHRPVGCLSYVPSVCVRYACSCMRRSVYEYRSVYMCVGQRTISGVRFKYADLH